MSKVTSITMQYNLRQFSQIYLWERVETLH